MRTNYDVHITFMDGQKIIITKANSVYVEDGCLHTAYVIPAGSYTYGEDKHLGSFPIHNIRTYVKEEN